MPDFNKLIGLADKHCNFGDSIRKANYDRFRKYLGDYEKDPNGERYKEDLIGHLTLDYCFIADPPHFLTLRDAAREVLKDMGGGE